MNVGNKVVKKYNKIIRAYGKNFLFSQSRSISRKASPCVVDKLGANSLTWPLK